MNSVPILYEDELIVIIDKPEGVPFHRAEQHEGIMDLLRSQGRQEPLFPVHRLDKITSGVMVLAKHRESAAQLGEWFAAGQIDKLYVALAIKKPSKKQGLITGDMVRSRRGSWKLTRGKESPARTRFHSFTIPDRRPGLRMYVLKPETGRTHQLRVALKSLGAPILGDALYGDAAQAQQEERTYLHATGIRLPFREPVICFCPPSTGEEFLSEAFQQAWQEYAADFSLFEKA